MNEMNRKKEIVVNCAAFCEGVWDLIMAILEVEQGNREYWVVISPKEENIGIAHNCRFLTLEEAVRQICIFAGKLCRKKGGLCLRLEVDCFYESDYVELDKIFAKLKKENPYDDLCQELCKAYEEESRSNRAAYEYYGV